MRSVTLSCGVINFIAEALRLQENRIDQVTFELVALLSSTLGPGVDELPIQASESSISFLACLLCELSRGEFGESTTAVMCLTRVLSVPEFSSMLNETHWTQITALISEALHLGAYQDCKLSLLPLLVQRLRSAQAPLSEDLLSSMEHLSSHRSEDPDVATSLAEIAIQTSSWMAASLEPRHFRSMLPGWIDGVSAPRLVMRSTPPLARRKWIHAVALRLRAVSMAIHVDPAAVTHLSEACQMLERHGVISEICTALLSDVQAEQTDEINCQFAAALIHSLRAILGISQFPRLAINQTFESLVQSLRSLPVMDTESLSPQRLEAAIELSFCLLALSKENVHMVMHLHELFSYLLRRAPHDSFSQSPETLAHLCAVALSIHFDTVDSLSTSMLVPSACKAWRVCPWASGTPGATGPCLPLLFKEAEEMMSWDTMAPLLKVNFASLLRNLAGTASWTGHAFDWFRSLCSRPSFPSMIISCLPTSIPHDPYERELWHLCCRALEVLSCHDSAVFGSSSIRNEIAMGWLGRTTGLFSQLCTAKIRTDLNPEFLCSHANNNAILDLQFVMGQLIAIPRWYPDISLSPTDQQRLVDAINVLLASPRPVAITSKLCLLSVASLRTFAASGRTASLLSILANQFVDYLNLPEEVFSRTVILLFIDSICHDLSATLLDQWFRAASDEPRLFWDEIIIAAERTEDAVEFGTDPECVFC